MIRELREARVTDIVRSRFRFLGKDIAEIAEEIYFNKGPMDISASSLQNYYSKIKVSSDKVESEDAEKVKLMKTYEGKVNKAMAKLKKERETVRNMFSAVE